MNATYLSGGLGLYHSICAGGAYTEREAGKGKWQPDERRSNVSSDEGLWIATGGVRYDRELVAWTGRTEKIYGRTTSCVVREQRKKEVGDQEISNLSLG
jgi:hypothetical protein